MKKHKITILGQTVSQKNSKQIAINPKTKKPFVMSNKTVKEWQQAAALQLIIPSKRIKMDGRAEISIQFYVKDNRRRDLDNMLSSITDALVAAKILTDDSWQYLKIGTIDAEIDKENPRAEITLTECQ